MQENNENNSTFSVRLKQVIDHQGVSVYDFSEKLGYKRPQTIYDFLSGRVNPSYAFFSNFIKSEFSDKINLRWLISGEGEMMTADFQSLSESAAIRRFGRYIDSVDLPYSEACDLLGVDSDEFYSMGYEGAPIPDGLIKKIAFIFEDIDLRWLVNGEGAPNVSNKSLDLTKLKHRAERYHSDAPQGNPALYHERNETVGRDLIAHEESTEIRTFDIYHGHTRYLIITPLIRRLDEYEYQHYLEIWDNPGELELFDRHAIAIDSVKFGIYRSFLIEDKALNSELSPGINEGDIVTGRRIDRRHWKMGLFRDELVIVSCKQGVFFRRIQKNNFKGEITLEATNPDKEKYPDFELDLDNTYEIYEIEVVTRYKK